MKSSKNTNLSTGDRRSFLRLAAGIGAATAGTGLLAACGGGTEATAGGREGAQTRVINGCASKAGGIYDGAGNVIGFIDAINDSVNASVVVLSPIGCDLREMKLWVGTDLSLLPVSGGTPNYSQFPLQHNATGATAQHEFTVSLASIGVSSASLSCAKTPPTYFVVGQVTTTCGTGTVVGYTSPNGAGGAYTYATFPLCCSDTPVVLAGCETAFAKGGYVFVTDAKANPEALPTLGLTKNRWGWAINLTAAGTTTYAIYAGAGLNKTGAGKQVGTLTIDYSGSQAKVTYSLIAGVTMTEAHLYAGDTKPTTLAPGQYGNTAYFATPASSHSFTVPLSDTGTDGVWLIAHAVVC